MSTVSELIRSEADGSLSFGDYTLGAKAKLDNFQHAGAKYKVKTFREITKLEKNDMFAYESVPGTAVTNMTAADGVVRFSVEGPEDAEITLGLEEETSYEVSIGGTDAGTMTTNLGGKLTISVELNGEPVAVEIKKA
ncbi:MAG: endosialidase [Lachnospiraceae bacterium]|nr:endosialidase [Lachnospiraceae bacterium]MDD7177553.1 endosialidase [bacterium]MDY5516529.1 endosialidase [Lachnospiraceae bacterium]